LDIIAFVKLLCPKNIASRGTTKGPEIGKKWRAVTGFGHWDSHVGLLVSGRATPIATSEEEIYEALNLSFVEPYLREGSLLPQFPTGKYSRLLR
jgi:hypothetical protein